MSIRVPEILLDAEIITKNELCSHEANDGGLGGNWTDDT